MAKIGMLLMHRHTPRDLEARKQLADALPDANVGEPDELGIFEIELDADDQEAALQRVWDGVTASGTDDHILFMEHSSCRSTGAASAAARAPDGSAEPDAPRDRRVSVAPTVPGLSAMRSLRSRPSRLWW